MNKILCRLRSGLPLFIMSVRSFPIEALMGISFMIILIVADLFEDALSHEFCWSLFFTSAFSPLFFVLTFTLHYWSSRLHSGSRLQWTFRVAYYLSYFIYLPFLLFFNFDAYVTTFNYSYMLLLSFFLLLSCRWPVDNRQFVGNMLGLLGDIFRSALVSGLLLLALDAILGSVIYLFGLETVSSIHRLIVYPDVFIVFVLFPLLFCFFRARTDESSEIHFPPLVDNILYYVLCPSVVIYTVLLYAYSAKVLFLWNLPKGCVAYLVFAFVLISFFCYVLHPFMRHRLYDKFFSLFSFIVIPPMTLYYVGTLRRITDYGFTESRIYLLLFGVLITLFLIMLCINRLRSYLIMTVMASVAVFVLTYIPGLSAKSLGVRSQKHIFDTYVLKYNLMNAKTHKMKIFEGVSYDVSVQGTSDKYVFPEALRRDMDARKAMASSYYYMSTTIGDDSLRSIYGPMPKLLTGIYGDVDDDKVDNNDEFNIFLRGISCVNTAGYPYLLQSDASDVCQVQEQANGDPYLSVKCGNADLNVNLKDWSRQHQSAIKSALSGHVVTPDSFVIRNKDVMAVLRSFSVERDANGFFFLSDADAMVCLRLSPAVSPARWASEDN